MHTDTKGLTKRGDIWWLHISRRINGRPVTLRESTGCREIELAIAYRDRRIAEVTAGNQTERPEGVRTFADAAAEYVLDLERRGKDTARTLIAINAVLDAIGLLPLDHVHQRTLQPWIDGQRGVHSSGTVERTLTVVKTVLKFAAEVLRDGHTPWLTTAPPKIRVPDWNDTRHPRPITWDEQDALVARLPKHLVGPVLWAVHTGAREQEVVTLRWDSHREVDGLPRWSVWWIPPEVRKASAKARVSDRDGRFVVCCAAAREVIDRQLGLDRVWIFPSPKGGRLARINNSAWARAAKEVNLTIRVHDLRHTWGQRAADAAIPLDTRAALMGHRRGSMTEHYSRPGMARLLEESERVVR